MEKPEFNSIIEAINHGSKLYIGLMPNIEEVNFGYSYLNNKLIFFCQGNNKSKEKLYNYITNHKLVNFIKWSDEGNVIEGAGIVTLLVTKVEKINGLNYIKMLNTEFDFDEYNITDLIIFKIEVENIYMLR